LRIRAFAAVKMRKISRLADFALALCLGLWSDSEGLSWKRVRDGNPLQLQEVDCW
jgi:hypothetical protein